MNVKGLEVYQRIDVDTYRGISRKFFPKWEGWELLEDEAPINVIDHAVSTFYLTYFYYYLKIDIINNFLVEQTIMNFATIHGKRKAIMKLEKACGFPITGKPSAELMSYTATNINEVVPMFFLELLEFYEFIGDIDSGLWVLENYRAFKSSL